MAWLRIVLGGSWLTVVPASVAGAAGHSAASEGSLAGRVGSTSADAEPLSLLGDEAPETIRRMLHWLQAGGATWKTGLRVRALGAGERGLVTIVPLRAHLHDLVDVPVNFAFSTDECTRNASSLVSKLPEQMRDGFGRSHALLHLCFLEHHVLIGNASSFAPYFGSLPRNLEHLPLLTSLNLSGLLQGSHLLHEINKHRQDLERRYEEIVWEVPEFRRVVSLAEFMKTYCMVESRTITRHDGNVTKQLMIPLIDLINHRSQQPNIRLGWSGPERIPMVVGSHGVAANSELFFKYSDMEEPASKFFKQFGFVDENLPVGVKVQFPLRRDHPGYLEKRMMFDVARVQHVLFMEQTAQETDVDLPHDVRQKMSEFPYHFMWLCSPAHNSFRPLHSNRIEEIVYFARFVVFEGSMAALQVHCDMQTKPPSCRKALEAKEEEAAAGRFLLDIVAEQLSLYPTSAEAADAELVKLPRSSMEWPYLRVRRDEQHCLLSLQATLQELYPGVPASGPAATASPSTSALSGSRSAGQPMPGDIFKSASKALSQDSRATAAQKAFSHLAGAGLISSITAAAVCGLVVRLLRRAKDVHAD